MNGGEADELAHFVEVFAKSDAVDLTLKTDDGIEFKKNDMVIILVPPVGDAVYNPLF